MAIIELDQRQESQLTEFKRGAFTVRYAYSRSKFAQEKKLRGEDYVVARIELNRLVFAICDGVSSSFFGGLAAQILGEGLLGWLCKNDVINMLSIQSDAMVVRASLYQALNERTKLGSDYVSAKDLSRIKYPQSRDIYEKRRITVGSQSNFICGSIEPRTGNLPNGRVWLFWLGDAILRGWFDDKDVSDLLQPQGKSGEGWSSSSGVVGEIQSYSCELTQIDCVMAYSDGLAGGASILRPGISVQEFDALVEQIGAEPKSDDVSYLEISVGQGVVDEPDDLVAELRAIETLNALPTTTPDSIIENTSAIEVSITSSTDSTQESTLNGYDNTPSNESKSHTEKPSSVHSATIIDYVFVVLVVIIVLSLFVIVFFAFFTQLTN